MAHDPSHDPAGTDPGGPSEPNASPWAPPAAEEAGRPADEWQPPAGQPLPSPVPWQTTEAPTPLPEPAWAVRSEPEVAPEPAWVSAPPPDWSAGWSPGNDPVVPPGRPWMPGPSDYPPPPPGRAAPGKSRSWKLGAFVACAVIGGLLGGALGAALSGDDSSDPSALPLPVPSPSSGRVSAPGSLADLVARVAPSVVSIRSTSDSSGFGIGQGTGVVITADGDILTNAHVVSDAETVKVVVPGQARAQEADIIGVDEDEDVAVIRIRDAALLPVADIGSASSLRLAEEVFAIGHALGLNGGPSVTRGIVSGLDRSNGPLAGLVQTDAALNPGNSGGPLFDSAGRVVGINTMVRSGAENVGFAIPIERAMAIAGRLRAGQPAPPKALLGVTTQAPEDGSTGAEVVKVSEGEPASRAGLREGDRITAVDGRPVTGPAGLAILVGDRSPGDVVEFTFQRGDEEKTVEVELATRD